MDPIVDLNNAINELIAHKFIGNFDRHEIELQNKILLQLRVLLFAIPSQRLKSNDQYEFVKKIIGEEPSELMLSMLTPTKRRKKLSEDEIIYLLENQNSRCSCCGNFLDKSSQPNIDHINPIAFGGEDELSNMQLLCKKCNLGKSDSLHWLMIAPFFQENPGREPSYTMRYCTLKRHLSKCASPLCENNSSNTLLEISHIIPIMDGGRNIIDNMTVLCEDHYRINRRSLFSELKREMSKNNTFNF